MIRLRPFYARVARCKVVEVLCRAAQLRWIHEVMPWGYSFHPCRAVAEMSQLIGFTKSKPRIPRPEPSPATPRCRESVVARRAELVLHNGWGRLHNPGLNLPILLGRIKEKPYMCR